MVPRGETPEEQLEDTSIQNGGSVE